jgi:hypothetical protein
MKDERIKQYKNGSKGKNPGQAKKIFPVEARFFSRVQTGPGA